MASSVEDRIAAVAAITEPETFTSKDVLQAALSFSEKIGHGSIYRMLLAYGLELAEREHDAEGG